MKLMQLGHQFYIRPKKKFKEKFNQVKKIITNTKEPRSKEKQDGDSGTKKG
jgi:hypothetical protein